MCIATGYSSHLMLSNSLFEVGRVAGVIAPVGTFHDIDPKDHLPHPWMSSALRQAQDERTVINKKPLPGYPSRGFRCPCWCPSYFILPRKITIEEPCDCLKVS